MIWKPNISMATSHLQYKLLYFLYHYVPAFFIDIGLRLSGSKLRLMKVYSKIYYHLQFFSYFGCSTWKFSDTNMQQLYSFMSPDDHHHFPCTLTVDDYASHIQTTADGIRKFFFKDTDADSLAAQRKYQFLRKLHYILLLIIYSTLAYILYILLKNFM